MMWKRRATDEVQQLPEERKALAERYTIDADEAQRREQLAAEASALEAEAAQEEARRAAEAERERKAAEEQARRIAEAEEQARRAAEAELQREAAAGKAIAEPTEPTTEPEPQPALVSELAGSSELPIYRWLDGS